MDKKLVFIGKFIFFGLLIWSYFLEMFALGSKGLLSYILALAGLIFFYIFIYGENVNPIKTSNKEFGKYTNIIGLTILFITLILLFLYGGTRFTILI
jgi:hypothetical protein